MAGPMKTLPGGAFLVTDAAPADTYAPEDFSDDDKAIKAAADDFAEREIAPRAEAMDAHDDALLRSLMLQAGSLGFLGVDIPEANGGLGLDLIASALVFEAMGGANNGSFAVTLGAHTGIGTWPILYFGTDEQRAAWLPGIASGEKVAAYALTEAGSGSDALAARTTAVLSEDGTHWIVNGGKVFITNAAIADVFSVFVKIGGQNACLVVEKGTPGFTVGKEERKLGIRGSSTCTLAFDDARVPAANLLGAVGKGHKIVLNTLNLGRFKLGCAAVGGLKASVTSAVGYAAGRKQFGRPILDFDAVRQKIADMTVKAWVGESMAYRAAGMLAERLEGVPPGEEAAKAIEEHTVECSLVKVALSEMLWDSVNHGVQVLGGYGYVEEGYGAARSLRDSRINLIFEGTNEINRMLAVDALTKQAMKGKVDLFGAVAALSYAPRPSGDLRRDALAGAKRATVHAIGAAVQKHMQALKDEQQVLLALADLLIAVYGMDSALLRLEKLEAAGKATSLHRDIVDAYFEEMRSLVRSRCDAVLASVTDDGARAGALSASRALQQGDTADLIGLRKRIAEAAAAKDGYPL